MQMTGEKMSIDQRNMIQTTVSVRSLRAGAVEILFTSGGKDIVSKENWLFQKIAKWLSHRNNSV